MLQWFMRVRLIAYHFNFFSECHLSIHFNVYSFYENGKQQMCIYNQVCLINIFFSLKVSKYKKNLQIVTNYRLWYHNLIISWGEKNENLYCTTDSACVNHKIHYVIYGILDYLHNYLYSADIPSISLL